MKGSSRRERVLRNKCSSVSIQSPVRIYGSFPWSMTAINRHQTRRSKPSRRSSIAQAIAAAGRGVAVVSDDPRFGLVPLRIEGPDGVVRINLYAAWDARHHAAATLAELADRLAAFCVDRYGPDVAPAPRRAGARSGR